jgi:5-methylcytosine-specific restriction enzyme subunit McrC
MPTYRLIEHKALPEPLPADFDVAGFKQYLDAVWQSRFLFDEGGEESEGSLNQPFLSFEYVEKGMGPRVKAGKYIGFIQFEDFTFEILPKLFSEQQADVAFQHLQWWLFYCRNLRFPLLSIFRDANWVDNFPETLISYFARYTYELISRHPYQQYEETTETMPLLRGRLNTSEYVRQSLSRGYWHELVCDHEPFQYSNRLNQIIKFVARKLSQLCRSTETYRWLEKVLFTLDEVEDLPITLRDCDTVLLNRFYEEYELCLDMCRFFLSDHYLNRQESHQRQFSFLLPMDYVFEDFIAGVTKEFFDREFEVKIQAKGWLTEQKVFQIRNDLLLVHRETGKKLVVDIKYKVRSGGSTDAKNGVSQTDLYQMVSYALRRETDQVLLLYPCCYERPLTSPAHYTVASGLLTLAPLHFNAVDLDVTGNSREEMVQQVVDQLRQSLFPAIYD